MAAPYIHAQSSARRFGGKPEEYLELHELMDSTKSAFPDNRHRAITHNSWFATVVIPKIFGAIATNSDGRTYIPKDVAEQHIQEDFGKRFTPTVQDYLEHMEFIPWMANGPGNPSSAAKIIERREKTKQALTHTNID